MSGPDRANEEDRRDPDLDPLAPELGPLLRTLNERLILSGIRSREMAEAAELQRAQFRTLVESLHDGILIAELPGGDFLLNEAARAIIGTEAPRDDVEALDFRAPSGEPLADHARPTTRALRGETFSDEEFLLLRKDGGARCVLASATSIREAGAIAMAMLVFRDVTDRRLLELRVAAMDRAAASAAHAANLSHLLNSPLAAVLGNVGFALESLPDARRRLQALGGAEADALDDGLREVAEALADAREGCLRIRGILSNLDSLRRDEAMVPSGRGAGTSPEPPKATRRGRVMVIDDEPSVCRVIDRLLSRDHDISVFHDAKTALARLLVDGGFDVVLCDLMMPGMSGLDLHARLTELRPELTQRMVFVTGGAATPQMEDLLRATHSPLLRKPMEPAALRKVVDQQVSARILVER